MRRRYQLKISGLAGLTGQTDLPAKFGDLSLMGSGKKEILVGSGEKEKNKYKVFLLHL